MLKKLIKTFCTAKVAVAFLSAVRQAAEFCWCVEIGPHFFITLHMFNGRI